VSGKIRVELNSDGVRELLRSPEMNGICTELAQGIAQRANGMGADGGYSVSSYTGTNRVNASVYCATREALRDNLKNNTLLKAVK